MAMHVLFNVAAAFAGVLSASDVAVTTAVAYRPEPSGQQARSMTVPRGPMAMRLGRFSAYGTHYSGEDVMRYVRGAVALSASLDSMGSRVDRIAITAYLSVTQRAKLHEGGWCVLDASERRVGNSTFGIDMRRFYRPLYSQEQAGREHRPGSSSILQARKDGAGTYYKFLAFALTKYKRVLHIDADTVLLEPPDRHLMHNAPYFAAPHFSPTSGGDGRNYDGFCSCLMILTPDSDVFGQILAKAASGLYLAFTNTDQDVLESIFTPSAVVDALPRSQHHPPQEARRVAHQAASMPRQPSCHFSASKLQLKIEAAIAGLPRREGPGH